MTIISTEMQMYTDYDWFALDKNNTIIHFASGGGELPPSVSSSEEDLKSIAQFIHTSLQTNYDITINNELDEYISFHTLESKDRYLKDFISMAKKGIYSFDKDNPGSFSTKTYHLVCKPIEKLNFYSLPNYVQSILNKTKIDVDISNYNSIQFGSI